MFKLIFYFLLGGLIVSLVTYLASLGKGLFSAFIATLPIITILTFVFTYLEGGKEVTLSYAKGLITFTPAWLSYVIFVILFYPNWGSGRPWGVG